MMIDEAETEQEPIANPRGQNTGNFVGELIHLNGEPFQVGAGEIEPIAICRNDDIDGREAIVFFKPSSEWLRLTKVDEMPSRDLTAADSSGDEWHVEHIYPSQPADLIASMYNDQTAITSQVLRVCHSHLSDGNLAPTDALLRRLEKWRNIVKFERRDEDKLNAKRLAVLTVSTFACRVRKCKKGYIPPIDDLKGTWHIETGGMELRFEDDGVPVRAPKVFDVLSEADLRYCLGNETLRDSLSKSLWSRIEDLLVAGLSDCDTELRNLDEELARFTQQVKNAEKEIALTEEMLVASFDLFFTVYLNNIQSYQSKLKLQNANAKICILSEQHITALKRKLFEDTAEFSRMQTPPPALKEFKLLDGLVRAPEIDTFQSDYRLLLILIHAVRDPSLSWEHCNQIAAKFTGEDSSPKHLRESLLNFMKEFSIAGTLSKKRGGEKRTEVKNSFKEIMGLIEKFSEQSARTQTDSKSKPR